MSQRNAEGKQSARERIADERQAAQRRGRRRRQYLVVAAVVAVLGVVTSVGIAVSASSSKRVLFHPVTLIDANHPGTSGSLVQQNMADFNTLRLGGTPTLMLDGKQLNLPQSIYRLSADDKTVTGSDPAVFRQILQAAGLP